MEEIAREIESIFLHQGQRIEENRGLPTVEILPRGIRGGRIHR